jgi:hypothetical protein
MLNLARIDGARHDGQWVPAMNFLRARDDNASPIANEAEAGELLDSLLALGLLEEAGNMDLGGGAAGSARAFRTRRFRITKKGFALWSQEIPPIAGVADERFGD